MDPVIIVWVTIGINQSIPRKYELVYLIIPIVPEYNIGNVDKGIVRNYALVDDIITLLLSRSTEKVYRSVIVSFKVAVRNICNIYILDIIVCYAQSIDMLFSFPCL